VLPDLVAKSRRVKCRSREGRQAVPAAIFVTRRRWARIGRKPELIGEIAVWGFPAGLLGGRIYS